MDPVCTRMPDESHRKRFGSLSGLSSVNYVPLFVENLGFIWRHGIFLAWLGLRSMSEKRNENLRPECVNGRQPPSKTPVDVLP